MAVPPAREEPEEAGPRAQEARPRTLGGRAECVPGASRDVRRRGRLQSRSARGLASLLVKRIRGWAASPPIRRRGGACLRPVSFHHTGADERCLSRTSDLAADWGFWADALDTFREGPTYQAAPLKTTTSGPRCAQANRPHTGVHFARGLCELREDPGDSERCRAHGSSVLRPSAATGPGRASPYGLPPPGSRACAGPPASPSPSPSPDAW